MSSNTRDPFPLIRVDLNSDPNPSHDFFFPDHHDHLSSPPSPSSSHAVIAGRVLFAQPQPHQEHHPHRANLVDKLFIAQGGPHDHPPSDVIEGYNNLSDRDCYHDHGRDLARDHHHEYCSVKWMSSKMRIMKKMTGYGKPSAAQKFESDPKREAVPPQASGILENDSSRNSNRSSSSGIEGNNPIIRVCTDCNTTKTPLWRSGPQGPKSLCNACGIRQRKARRAMAAAVAAANGEAPLYPNATPTQKVAKLQQKKKKKKRPSLSEDGSDPQPKKKRKILVRPPAGPRKLCFEEFRLRLSERISDFQRVFPQDEKEAAILLMALSYG